MDTQFDLRYQIFISRRQNYIKQTYFLDNDFFKKYDPKSIGKKSKKRQMVKTLCRAKEIISRVKRPMEWEKIFANRTSNMVLISKIYGTRKTQ